MAANFQDFTPQDLFGMRREASLAPHKLMLGNVASSLGEMNGTGSKSATFVAAESERLRLYIDELSREIDHRQGNRQNVRTAFYPWADGCDRDGIA